MPESQRDLVRKFYFAEAMAMYEQYYEPLATTMIESDRYSFLNSPGRGEDRPLTWVPLVFHCTDAEHFPAIIESGYLNEPVSLTEIPIGELDRMKIRRQGKQQIAIGFPRAYVQEVGFAPVLYLKYLPELQRLKDKYPAAFEALHPFIDYEGDVSAMQEIRTKRPLALDNAVWLLTTELDSGKRPFLPSKDQLAAKFGKFPTSYWHRSHQMGVLDEWQFLRVDRTDDGSFEQLEFMGEHYWKQQRFSEITHRVQMPVGKSFNLRFQATVPEQKRFEGPYRFIDVAQRIKQIARDTFPDEKFTYSIITDL